FGPRLTPAEVGVLTRWIEEGAEWPPEPEGTEEPPAVAEEPAMEAEPEPEPAPPIAPVVAEPGLALEPLPPEPLPEGPIVFSRHVLPILAGKCYSCHGPDEKGLEGDLRLDTHEALYQDLGGALLLSPGDVAQSYLYERVAAEDEFDLMPPPDAGERLTERELALLRRWIEEGAKCDTHWAFQNPTRPAVPQTDPAWARSAIDHFSRRGMEARGLAPSPPASKERLLRRVHFDLTGLPPSLAQIDAFLSDDSDDAFEEVVDRLLASPAHAERMALSWMRTSRYDDARPEAWRWREAVIAAFQANQPFDQFTLEQLAGDLLPDATDAQRHAADFLSQVVVEREHGVSEDEARARLMDARVRKVCQTWLGINVDGAAGSDAAAAPVTRYDHALLAALLSGDSSSDAVISFLPPLPPDAPRDRLGLARWLVAGDNPLTARVAVDRLWAMVFGRGLVDDGDDFSVQSDPPSHPELLDWLAVELREHDWNLRHVLRLIVTSGTYRQSSRASAELMAMDPDNRSLTRGPRHGLDAEMIWDQALVISGTLDASVGGPSMDREGGRRRGLYAWWDPSIEMALTHAESMTPEQALRLMNEPTFLAAARALGDRVLREEIGTIRRLERAFRLCTSRIPDDTEMLVLTRLFQRQFGRYIDDPEASRALLDADARPIPEDIDAGELAAWTSIVSVLLNLDETLHRG
ncbi:MAG: PSD1 and planctomycete cytochrome C domain-containing protein, partial [Planctomycetota bacterium]|nr:PSD1 and planctomycete cytochrome C domain-containing protein [Planctomycetota bacterium]